MKKKKSRRLSDYPKNVPRALIRAYRLAGENGLRLAKQIGVDDAHISKLLNKGVEPKDKIIRERMMLPKLKIKREKTERKPRPPEPDYIKKWKHLPTAERHQVIKEYLSWKSKNKLTSS
jgi:hypothetical protein